MPSTPKLVIVKSFTYRDQPEEWSNGYHFIGTKPTTSAEWKTLADAVIAEERLLVSNRTKFVRAYGYAADAIASEWQHNYLGPPDTAVLGAISYLATTATPGDAAGVVRWFTGRWSVKGKKIYCRKYFHDLNLSNTDHDELSSGTVGVMQTYAAKMIDGTLPGGFRVSDNHGSLLTAPAVSTYVTTRTLKRRGKRPPS